MKNTGHKFENTVEFQKHVKKINKIFGTNPIWRIVIKMALPATLLYLTIGLYNFTDSILAVYFAPNNYVKEALASGYSASNLVRVFIQSVFPIYLLMNGIAVLFGVGIGTRVSINIGNKKNGKALNVLKSGTTFGMLFSVIMIFVLIGVAKPWIALQITPELYPYVVNNAFSYAWIFILGLPFITFNQIVSNIFRSEGKNKIVLIAWIIPIFLNLFLDWLFMGPFHIGVAGGALATTISYFVTSIILIFGMFSDKSTILHFDAMFGFYSIKWISLVTIFLIGVSPFLRTFSSSVMQTTQSTIIRDISGKIFSKAVYFKQLSEFAYQIVTGHPPTLAEYNAAMTKFGDKPIDMKQFNNFKQLCHDLFNKNHLNKNHPTDVRNFFANYFSKNNMIIMSSGAFPIYALLIPMIFGLCDSGRPIIAYNFGANKFKRVKQAFWYTTLISFVIASFLYIVTSFYFGRLLLIVLRFNGYYLNETNRILKIYLLIIPLFSISVSGMLLLGSTDRITLSAISASMQGIIVLFPVIYTFKYLATSNYSYIDTFWWYSPTNGLISSLIILFFSIFTLRKLKNKNKSLEERIDKIYQWAANRSKRMKAKQIK